MQFGLGQIDNPDELMNLKGESLPPYGKFGKNDIARII
jgi:hypothetical protein